MAGKCKCILCWICIAFKYLYCGEDYAETCGVSMGVENYTLQIILFNDKDAPCNGEESCDGHILTSQREPDSY